MSFKILGPNHYSCALGDVVTYSTTAVGVPFNANIGPHSAGAPWTVVQAASPASPTQIQRFTMPAANDHFTVSYGFGPAAPSGAHYLVTISGNGGQDGPFQVKQGAFPTVTLQYAFDLAAQPPAPKGVRRAAPARQKTVKNAAKRGAPKKAKKKAQKATSKKTVKKTAKKAPRR